MVGDSTEETDDNKDEICGYRKKFLKLLIGGAFVSVTPYLL